MEDSLAKKKSDTENVQILQLLQSVGGECKSLALATEQLQSVIGDILNGSVSLPPGMDHKLQDLDRITQTLCALSDFMELASSEANPDWAIDAHRALQSVLLADLASRLVPSQLVRTDNDPYRNASGDCILL